MEQIKRMKGPGITAMMVMTECLHVVSHNLTKAATNTGMSDFVYSFYSNALGFFFLLTCSIFCHRQRPYPPLTDLVSSKLFLVGLLRSSKLLKHVGIDLSSPTLATAISDLTPAFAFIIAIIWRMEVLDLGMKSSQAKIIGTIISIAGALIVTSYKGVRLTSASPLLGKFLNQLLFSIKSKWVIGGFVLLLESFFHALNFVLQARVMEYSEELLLPKEEYSEPLLSKKEYSEELLSSKKEYSKELMANLFCCFSVTIISVIAALIAERSNPDAWKIKSNMELIAIVINAAFSVAFRRVVHLKAVREKGPIYLAIFKPLRTVIAFIFGIIFLGETIHPGRVIGGAIAAGGFYAVIWSKAQGKKGLLKRTASGFSDRRAISTSGKFDLTHAQLQEIVDHAASLLFASGIGHGDVVALTFPNTVEFVVMFLAVIRCRAIPAPLNAAHTAKEFEFYISDTKSKLLITSQDGVHSAVTAASKLGIPHMTATLSPRIQLSSSSSSSTVVVASAGDSRLDWVSSSNPEICEIL